MKYLKDFRIVIILLVLIVIVVLARFLRKNYYELSVQEAYERTLKTDEFISFEEYKSTKEQYFLIDLRDEEAYNSSHIEDAVNIPFKDLLKNVDLKDKNRKCLLYSDRVSKTVKAKIILNQMGYLNVYYLDFPNESGDSKFQDFNSISLDEEFKYKFRPDTTIRPE